MLQKTVPPGIRITYQGGWADQEINLSRRSADRDVANSSICCGDLFTSPHLLLIIIIYLHILFVPRTFAVPDFL